MVPEESRAGPVSGFFTRWRLRRPMNWCRTRPCVWLFAAYTRRRCTTGAGVSYCGSGFEAWERSWVAALKTLGDLLPWARIRCSCDDRQAGSRIVPIPHHIQQLLEAQAAQNPKRLTEVIDYLLVTTDDQRRPDAGWLGRAGLGRHGRKESNDSNQTSLHGCFAPLSCAARTGSRRQVRTSSTHSWGTLGRGDAAERRQRLPLGSK
jgi:hypothetical protein